MTIARVGARTRARASIAAHIDSKEFVPAFFPSFSCLASRARDARGAARGGIRRRETPLQRAPSRASARRARRGAALERRAVRCSTFFLLSRRFRDDRAESRARRGVPRCPRARPRPRHKVETPKRNVTRRHDEEDAREKVSATPTTRGGERARRGGPKFRAARANRARARSRRGRPSDMCARGCESSREALRGAGARRERASGDRRRGMMESASLLTVSSGINRGRRAARTRSNRRRAGPEGNGRRRGRSRRLERDGRGGGWKSGARGGA
jgi:hypothetical protein